MIYESSFLEFNEGWRVGRFVGLIDSTRIVKLCMSIGKMLSSRMMNMSKNMDLRFDSFHILQQSRTPGIFFILCQIKYSSGGPMRYENIYILGYLIPDVLCPGLMILEAPIIKQGLIGRPKNLNTFDLYCLML